MYLGGLLVLPESTTAIVARNERWSGSVSTEPFEAGWAKEAIFFVRALKQSIGPAAVGHVELSPDGMHWTAEGTEITLPADLDGIVMARVAHFGKLAAHFCAF